MFWVDCIIKSMINQHNMAMERATIFANGVAYDISTTEKFILTLFEDTEMTEDICERYRLIFRYLSNCKFLIETELDDLVPDPFTGVYVHFETWLLRYGVQDLFMMELDDTTIGTYDCDDVGFELHNEEAITADEEDDLVIFSNMGAVMDDPIVIDDPTSVMRVLFDD